MPNVKSQLVLAGSFAIITVSLVMLGSKSAGALNPVAGSAPVNIVGPLPLPVTGSTTVAGTVAATQSGPWNVSASQSGEWSVRNLDEPGRNPYQEEMVFLVNQCNPGGCTADVHFSPVPAGKRLVIKTVSGEINLVAGGTVGRLSIGSLASGAGISVADISLHPTLIFSDTTSSTFPFNEQTLLFVDAGNQPLLFAFANASGFGNSTATLTGYFVDVP